MCVPWDWFISGSNIYATLCDEWLLIVYTSMSGHTFTRPLIDPCYQDCYIVPYPIQDITKLPGMFFHQSSFARKPMTKKLGNHIPDASYTLVLSIS